MHATRTLLLVLGITTHFIVNEKNEYEKTKDEGSNLLTLESNLYDIDCKDETLVAQNGIWTIIKDDILTNKSCIGSCLCYSSFGVVIAVYDVLLVLWLEMPRKNFGRDYDTNDVGNLYMISGSLAVLATHLFISKIIASLKKEVCYSAWLVIVSFMISITPTFIYIKSGTVFSLAWSQ